MLTKTLINAVVILGVSIGAVSYLNAKNTAAAERQKATQTEAAEKAQPSRQAKTVNYGNSASVVSIPKDRRSGQFHFKGRVNSGYVDFLVDTGASSVALTLADARKAGIKQRDLTYNVPVSTAGGQIYAARVNLDQVALGGIMLRDVDAFVIPEGLDTSLLGMSWLGQLQEVKATPNALLLRL